MVARKPLAGTHAENVLAWGTGGLNIAATRIPMSDTDAERIRNAGGFMRAGWTRPDGTLGNVYEGTADGSLASIDAEPDDGGRWPSNLVLGHGPTCTEGEPCPPGCPIPALDEHAGNRPGMARPLHTRGTTTGRSIGSAATYGTAATHTTVAGYDDTGGPSRFFPNIRWHPDELPFYYSAKAGKAERNNGLDDTENLHPTVKPLELIRWLVRLVTPPGGTVCDPFLGSGTTAAAAVAEGHRWIGCELTDDYLPIITARIAHAERTTAGPHRLARLALDDQDRSDIPDDDGTQLAFDDLG